MLKNIPNILTPELLKILMEMGHGDELVLADGNYPRLGHPSRVVCCDGHGIPELLDAIMKFMPLDSYVENPTILMEVLPNDPYVPTIWNTYREIIGRYEESGARELPINKYDFYKRGAQAYAVVTTSEQAMYANVILKKGVIKP
jgi:L-fucose mutarotase